MPCPASKTSAKWAGLSQKIPVTHRVFLIGTTPSPGFHFFAALWSKDEILAHAFTHHHYMLYGIGVVGASSTAFYMSRLTYLTFYGKSRMSTSTPKNMSMNPRRS